MAHTCSHPVSDELRYGFVVAMRGRLTTSRRRSLWEWIIVSRWGARGEYLSLGRTWAPALLPGAAPIHLQPRQTALAGLLRLPPGHGAATFLFLQHREADICVAGEFAGVEGYLRLQGHGETLRLHAEGTSRTGGRRLDWRLDACRADWIGEFLEAREAHDVLTDA